MQSLHRFAYKVIHALIMLAIVARTFVRAKRANLNVDHSKKFFWLCTVRYFFRQEHFYTFYNITSITKCHNITSINIIMLTTLNILVFTKDWERNWSSEKVLRLRTNFISLMKRFQWFAHRPLYKRESGLKSLVICVSLINNYNNQVHPNPIWTIF